MSKQNLSAVAIDVINAHGITATNLINAYGCGGERFIGFVDTRFATAVKRGKSSFGQGVRANPVDGQKRKPKTTTRKAEATAAAP